MTQASTPTSLSLPPLQAHQEIDLVFWDLGDVLISLDFPQLFGVICPLLETTPKAFHKALFASGIFQRANTGETTPEIFHQEVIEALGVNATFGDFCDAWVQFFQPRPGMGALLHDLEGQVEMWLLSNTDPLHHQACQRQYDYLQVLTGQLTSYGLGAMKPDAAIYQRALDHVSRTGHRCLFFDDKPENIEGARAMGIHAYLYTSEEDCRDTLRRYHLLK